MLQITVLYYTYEYVFQISSYPNHLINYLILEFGVGGGGVGEEGGGGQHLARPLMYTWLSDNTPTCTY